VVACVKAHQADTALAIIVEQPVCQQLELRATGAGPDMRSPIFRCDSSPLDTFYGNDVDPLGIWRQWAPRAQGQAVKGGHLFPEDSNGTEWLIKQFLVAT
jgi:hypothetical protein